MDIISTAFIVVLNTDVGKSVKDTYQVLKGALQRKFGKASYIAGAVKMLENKPDSISRQATLKEEVRMTKAQKDSQLNQLAEALLKKLKATPEGLVTLKKYETLNR
jgi:Fic family protein